MSATTTHPSHGSYLMPSLEHATVADAMHPGILSCEPDATLTEVARMMATHHIHCIAMIGISPEQPGEKLVWGLITDVDLLGAGIGNDPHQTAQTLAREPTSTIEPTTPLLQAVQLMVRDNASHLIVIDPRQQRPVGILSTLDIAGILAWGEA